MFHIFFLQREPILGALEKLVMSYNDKTVYHACWAVAYIARVDIQLVISGNFIVLFKRLLVKWLDPFEIENSPEIEAILRTYVSVSAGHNTDINVLIQEGILPCLHRMINLGGLRVRDREFRKMFQQYACRVISNVVAGSQEQIQAVIEARIIGPLIRFLERAEMDIKEEAIWAISNIISYGSTGQVRDLLEQGLMQPLCDLLTCQDPLIVGFCLEILVGIGHDHEVDNIHQFVTTAAGGMENLKNLFDHDDCDIVQMAVNFYVAFLLDHDDNDAEYNANAVNLHLNVPPGDFNFPPVLD
jgi:hypothetical protein